MTYKDPTEGFLKIVGLSVRFDKDEGPCAFLGIDVLSNNAPCCSLLLATPVITSRGRSALYL